MFGSYANGVDYIVAWNKLYRKKLWDKLRYPEGKMNEDEFVVHNFVRQCDKIAGVDYVGYNYVQRSGSIIHQLRKKANFDKCEALEMRINYFVSTERYDFARKQLSLIFDVLCFQYMQCRTMQEKNIFREKLQKYSTYLKEFYQERSVPKKEMMKALGCKCTPWLFCRIVYVYRGTLERTWNWRHWGKW
jgi:hypothetical protein